MHERSLPPSTLRFFLVLAAASLACSSDTPPSMGRPTSAPEEQGFDSETLADLIETIDREDLPIDSLLIARNGAVILDAHFYPYLGDLPHDVASVTKSITSTLVGIAVDEGLLEVDDLIATFFPEIDASKDDIEIMHLLSMSSGLDCGYTPGEQELSAMIVSDDYVEYALDLPVLVPPGTTFAYCSPGSHLLSAIVGQVAGMTALEFAQGRLFEPLGIVGSVWPSDPQDVSHGWGDLRMYPRDMAKIGQLVLDQGEVDDARVVSAEWVTEATRSAISAGEDGTGYGYQWWILPAPFEGAYEARGRGGQAIVVWPDNDLVVVFTGRGVDVRDQVAPFLAAALKSEEPIESNPDGNERLDAAIAGALVPPPALPVPALPPAAEAMSGRVYQLDDNPFDTLCVSLRFDSASDVTFDLTTSDGELEMKVGMDGVPRFSDGSQADAPIGLLGEWIDSDVFLLRYDEVTGPNHLEVEVLVAEGAESIEVEFSDPGAYFPTTRVPGTAVEECGATANTP